MTHFLTGRLQTGIVAWAILIVAVLTPSFMSAQPASDASDKKILFLNSYHHGYEWSDSITTGLLAVFAQNAPDVGIYIEYLDTKHFKFTADRRREFIRGLAGKYPPDFFDLVVTSDDRALEFAISHRDELFPGRPVVFCGVNHLDPDKTPLPEGFTGIVEMFDYQSIIDMVRAVFPGRRQAKIIVDNSITGDQIVESAARFFARQHDFTHEILSGRVLTHSQMYDRLARLGEDAFVIIGVWQRDSRNRYITVAEGFNEIVGSTSAPVFVVLRTSPSVGIAGGAAVSGVHQGRSAGRIALEILEGRDPDDIPVSTECAFDRMLNRVEIEKRWGVDWKSLPPEIRSIPPIFNMEKDYQLPRELMLTSGEARFIRENPEIHVVMRDAPPLMIPGDPPAGAIVDILNEISARTGLRFKYDFMEYETGQCVSQDLTGSQKEGLSDHKPAIPDEPPRPPIHILAGMTPSPNQKYIFTEPYIRLKTVIFGPTGHKFIAGLEDLKSNRVGIVNESALLRTIRRDFPEIKTVPFNTARQGMQALRDGRIDAWVGFLSTGVWLKKEMGLTDIEILAPTNLPAQPMSLAIPSNQPVLAEILAKSILLLPEGRSADLKEQYMDSIVIKRGWSTQAVLKMLLGIALTFLLVLTILLFRIRKHRNIASERGQNLQVTLDSIGDAVITTDNTGKIVRLNPVAEKLSGWTLSEAIGQDIGDVLVLQDPEEGTPLPNPAKKIIDGGSVSGETGEVTRLLSRNKTRYLIEDSAAPIRDSQGELTGVIIVFRDVTQKYLYQEQLQHSRKMEAIGQLAGGVAHDFNNMLAAIQGYTELVSKKLDYESNEKAYCDRILVATERAAGLTSKLLSFARKGKALSTPIDVHESIGNALGLLERSLDRNIVLGSDLRATNSMIVGDPSQIQSAVLNLCINARDAMPDGGRLDITTDNVHFDEIDCRNNEFDILPGEYIVIRIRDTGTGISREAQQHMFEPFYTTKETGKGTGLGLAAVHGTILEHDGAVRFYTEIDKGTQFNIYLPTSQEKPDQVKEEYCADIHREGLVLLIEDEPIISSMAETMLSERGFEVLTAENGRIGVQMFKENADRLKLVILDVIMPEMDGMTALNQMKEIRTDIPFLVASGFSFDHRRDQFLKAGACAFLAKPFRNAELIKAVDECLRDAGTTQS